MSLLRSIALCTVLGLPAGLAAASAPGPGPDTGGLPPLRVFTERETGGATMAWSAVQDRSGTMYFGCNTVMSFDGERWRPERMDPTYLVRGLDIGPNGRIWVAGVNQIGWFERNGRGQQEYHSLLGRLPLPAADLGDVWRVYALGDDAALFVAWDRVLRWDGRRMTSWALPGMHLLWSTRTARGVYVHYPPVGLLRIGAHGPELVAPASVVGSAEIRWLDDSGEAWTLLTSQGFRRLRHGLCVPLEVPASAFVRDGTPTCAVRLGDGTLAVGTLRRGIALVAADGSILRTFDVRSGLPANSIYSLFADRDGALWGMGPSPIFRLGLNSGTTLYTSRNGYPPGGCDSLAEAGGSIFIASHNGVLRLETGPQDGPGQFSALPLASTRFYSLLSIPQGLAVGSLQGLGLWTPEGMRPVARFDEAVFRTSPSRSRPGRVLASLFDRVVSIDPNSGASEVVADGLPDYGDSIADEGSGRVWVGTPSRGLFVADPGSSRALPAGPLFGYMPAAGPAFVAVAGSTVIALTNAGAYCLEPGSIRFRAVRGYPGGNPTALSNPDRTGAIWAALEPGAGGRSPRLGRLTASPGGSVWTPESFEGLADVGSLLGLRLVQSNGREELWMSGTEGLLRAEPAALAPHPPPRRPQVRAWARQDGGELGAPLSGLLPYATRGIHFEFSAPDFGMHNAERFETMLDGADAQWSAADQSAARDLSGLREGHYDFRVRLVTDSGETGEAAVLHFQIAPPWWRTPAARLAFLLLAGLGVASLSRLRTRALRRRAAELERMVRQRTDELEKANAAKTEFVASMSHEIRNPMGGILASAFELAATGLDPGQQRLVSTLQSCASFLGSLVEDVLDFAAIEAGAYQVNHAPFRPVEILEAVVLMLGAGAAEAGMTVTMDPDLPDRIHGDAGRIQQVIVNFTVNALKFGGRTIGLAARSDGDHAVFTVADDGAGIPLDEQKNLFIRFSRLKSARNSAIPGTGLGLAVCRELAERMGGTVGFTTQAGAGSIFFLRIPLQAVAPEGSAVPGAAEPRRALVVEDIDYNARALGLMLGRLGFAVEVATDGEAALPRLAAVRYDAVFLDCDLPRTSGVEVARQIRVGEAGGPRTPLIATTAYSTPADRQRCAAAGMDGFIPKPITPEKLRRALAAAIPGGVFREIPPTAPGAVRHGIDLTLLGHLGTGASTGLGAEVARYLGALDQALGEARAAWESGRRPAVASAAHRVLSLARMVGAEELAETAQDLQDLASAYTEAELADEIQRLGLRAAGLRLALEAAPAETALSSSRAF